MKGTTMSLVEKEITRNNVELAKNNPELNGRREREQKFVSFKPRHLHGLFASEAMPIEQIYLSSPEDEFSLRVRKQERPEGVEYTATLKDRGTIVDGARDRLEINTPISREAYEHYATSPDLPRVMKRRAEPFEGVTVDFIDETKSNIQIVEIEHPDPDERARLASMMQELTHGNLVNMTHDPQIDNEALAYTLSKAERPKLPESLDTFSGRVVSEMIAQYTLGKNQVVVGLTGMSGSGKTTVTRAIQDKITELFGESFTPLVLSTDDYHFGKKHLEATYGAPWTEWDDPRTYNTAELARDLELMATGQTLIRRHFDFTTEEVVFDEEVAPSPFIVIEGLYAGSPDLQEVRDLHFKLPTSVATAIGRDVRRLVIENRANRVFPTPESRLRYQLETALPLYESQERPSRNSFNATARPLAERAFMLERLAGMSRA